MLLSALALTRGGANGDTLTVTSALMEGPYPLQQPLCTDSLNMKGTAFDIKEVLDQNLGLTARTRLQRPAGSTLAKGSALRVAADSLPQLRMLHFNVQTPRFVKATLQAPGLADYRVYVNGSKCADGQLELVPGRTDILLQVLSQKTGKDSFDVRIVGDSLAGVVVNAAGKRPFSIGQQTWGDHYAGVALSPSGRYVMTRQYYMRPNGTAQYTSTLTDLTKHTTLFSRNEYLSWQWLPGSEDVLYYTRTGGTGRELVIYNAASGQEKVVADNLPEGSFSISPKGDYLIFNKGEEGKPTQNSLKHIEEPDDRQPGWRNRNSLWRYDVATGVFQRLTFGKAGVSLADISADGRSLLLQYSRTDMSRQPFYKSSFVRMDAYTGKAETLLADTGFVSGARFSPDGKKLLVSASPAAFDGVGSEVPEGQTPQGFDIRLYLYDIDKKTAQPLLKNFGPSVAKYEWNKGDGMVYFLTDNRTGKSLFRLNPTTMEVTSYTFPVTYIEGYSIASAAGKNPKAVFYGQSPMRARDMYACTLSKPEPTVQRIGSIDFDEIYRDVAICENHPWQFKASRGDSIDGFYLLPPDFDASKKYPMIVYYYGGCTPSSNVLEAWYPFQAFAAQGYVVYVVNPSGAIGYGQEFASRHVNTWGKESGDDIIEGVKTFCAEHAFVNKDKIGCLGASYGGFMTQYLQTRTDLFAAAISHAGISNIASYWGGGYWGYSYGEVAQYGSYPWNNPKLYVEQSPLFNADKIHTPLLLIHGTVDTNVPTNESQQLYTALKILGRETAYVQVEGENHVVTNPDKRLHWLNTIYAWFAKYLKDDSAWWDSL